MKILNLNVSQTIKTINIYIYIHIFIHICIYIYIYIAPVYVCIFIYIHIILCIFIVVWLILMCESGRCGKCLFFSQKIYHITFIAHCTIWI